MFSRMLQLGATLAVGAVLVTGSAEALTVPITDGGSYTANTTDTFAANPSSSDFTAGVPFNHYYTFTSLDGLKSDSLVTVHVPNPGTTRPGIADLYIKWLDITQTTTLASVHLTNSAGTTINDELVFSFNLISKAVLYLTGTPLAVGETFYDLTVNFSNDVREQGLPLPPALLLFGSALVGLGALGRRKRKAATV